MNILIQESTDKSLTKSQGLTQLVDQKEQSEFNRSH